MTNFSDKQWVLGLLTYFFVCFIFFYPKMLLLLDEYSYFNQAVALSTFSPNLIIEDLTTTEPVNITGNPYLPGTSISLALLIKLFGKKSVFLLGASCFIISVLLLLKVFQRLKLSRLGILIFFIYPPLLMLTRTVMSGMPSLLLISVFIYFFFCLGTSKTQYICLSLIHI